MKTIKYGIWYIDGNYWCSFGASGRAEYTDINQAYTAIWMKDNNNSCIRFEIREIKEGE